MQIKGDLMTFRPDIKVLDCTLRDGGLVNSFRFSDDFVRDLYLANIKAGVDYMEFGYKASKEIFNEDDFGKWKFCNDADIRKIVGDNKTAENISVSKIADDTDYRTEFLALKLSSKVVKSVDEAISHINKFGTGHSECIVTNSLANAEKFQKLIDAAAVYVNASTRFTDGFEFGLGAEIGISTQKLHARGPMGLEELNSYKYVIRGNGQTRK